LKFLNKLFNPKTYLNSKKNQIDRHLRNLKIICDSRLILFQKRVHMSLDASLEHKYFNETTKKRTEEAEENNN